MPKKYYHDNRGFSLNYIIGAYILYKYCNDIFYDDYGDIKYHERPKIDYSVNSDRIGFASSEPNCIDFVYHWCKAREDELKQRGWIKGENFNGIYTTNIDPYNLKNR